MRLCILIILAILCVDLSLQYSTIDGLKACYVTTDGYSVVGDPPVTYHFRKFNDDVWRVKEVLHWKKDLCRLFYLINIF